jgi:hypothetical protein
MRRVLRRFMYVSVSTIPEKDGAVIGISELRALREGVI